MILYLIFVNQIKAIISGLFFIGIIFPSLWKGFTRIQHCDKIFGYSDRHVKWK